MNSSSYITISYDCNSFIDEVLLHLSKKHTISPLDYGFGVACDSCCKSLVMPYRFATTGCEDFFNQHLNHYPDRSKFVAMLNNPAFLSRLKMSRLLA